MSLLSMLVYGFLAYWIGYEVGSGLARRSCTRRLAAEWKNGYQWRCAEERGEVVNVDALLAQLDAGNQGGERG